MQTHRHSQARPAARDRHDLMQWQALGHAAHAGSILYLLLLVGMFASGAFGPAERYGGWQLLLSVAVIGGTLLLEAGNLLKRWQHAQHPLAIAVLLALGLAMALGLPATLQWLARRSDDGWSGAVVGLAVAAMLWIGWTQLRPFLRRRP